MPNLANSVDIWQNIASIENASQLWWVRNTSSRKVENVLLAWPQTNKYINHKDILIADDDMISIFGRVADKRYWTIKRWETELQSVEKISPQIEEWLNEDIRICLPENIDHLEVSVEVFKQLYIEWKIPYHKMKEAQVAPWLVVVKDIEFNTNIWVIKLSVFVSPEFQFAFASVDKNWRTI